MLHAFSKPFLLTLEPERAHQLALWFLKYLSPFMQSQMEYKPVKVMGLWFPNKVGLAAGFDKNGEVFEALFKLGFGHVEVGTLTPLPQDGNSKPRLFRLPKDKSIINRMGFNSCGVEHFTNQFHRHQRLGILGVNIGKNKSTEESKAAQDYLFSLEKAYPIADYISINVSSPNTPNLRKLESGLPLKNLLKAINEKRKCLEDRHTKTVPFVVKISPDLSVEQLDETAEILLKNNVQGVIATNTTLSREGLVSHHKAQSGGLSGAPLMKRSTEVVARLRSFCGKELAIIAVGGVMNVQDAADKFAAGADLVQIYTGFIYKGPKLIKQIAIC